MTICATRNNFANNLRKQIDIATFSSKVLIDYAF
jgi:hypothetical protein